MRPLDWLRPPTFEDPETTRQARVLYRLLRAMAALAVLGFAVGLLDRHNQLAVTLFFYGLLFSWFGLVAAITRTGRVVLAVWIFASLLWLLVAFVTLSFGGLQGQNASIFAVVTLIVGSVVGGRAAIGVAVASSAWCGLVMYLELTHRLPWNLGPYTPANAWSTLTITVLLTSVLLHESLSALAKMHGEAERAFQDRDEALRRSIQGQKMELVGSLTSGIAHDFNNLLTVIFGAVEGLRTSTQPTDTETLALLEDLTAATSRSALMTNQLLSLGRTKSSAREPVDMGAIVESGAKMLPRLLGASVEVKTRTEPHQWVLAARSACEQILLNLAVNARDAMPRGGTLELGVRQLEERVVLSVRDSGVGMTEEVRARIFEPFFTTKATGTGLGLATVRQLVSQYEGLISVESEPGRGAAFHVSFPRVPAPARAEELRSAGLATAPVVPAEPGHRILVVEDDALVRKTLARMLTADGYDVTAVQDGEEGLALVAAATSPIACVVTDVAMRRMDGETLATELASLRPSLPVVLVSGNREPNLGPAKGPPRAFLPKPVEHEQLRQAIRAVTRRAFN